MRYQEHKIDWTDATVARLWDYYSRTPPYSEIYFSKRFGDRMLRRSGLPLRDRLRVLDFGCGPGYIWEHLKAMDSRWEYCGLDFSPDSIAKLQARAKGHPGFEDAQAIAALPSGFAEASFDAVLLFEVVEHLRDEHLDATLNEIRRVLKPRGHLVVSTPNAEDLSSGTRHCPECGAIFHEWQHVRSWSAEALTDKIGAFGFKGEKIQTLDFSARGLRGAARQWARRLWHGRPNHPHMIALFSRV